MKKDQAKTILKVIIPSIILLFLTITIFKSWSEIKDQFVPASPIFFVGAFFSLIITFLGGAFFWKSILSSLNFPVPYFEALRIFTISNFGRFVPGVIVHYLARIYMSKKIGLSIKQGSITVILEAYYTLSGAYIVGLLGIASLLKLINFPPGLLFIYILVAVLILTVPLRIIIPRIPFLEKKIPEMIKIDYSGHFFLNLVSVALFMLNGLAFYLLCFSFFGLDFGQIWLITGLFALSWITGFITPVAPGGLGVSDLSFVFLLSPFYTLPQASFLVIIYRIILLAAEGFVFIAVLAASKARF